MTAEHLPSPHLHNIVKSCSVVLRENARETQRKVEIQCRIDSSLQEVRRLTHF